MFRRAWSGLLESVMTFFDSSKELRRLLIYDERLLWRADSLLPVQLVPS